MTHTRSGELDGRYRKTFGEVLLQIRWFDVLPSCLHSAQAIQLRVRSLPASSTTQWIARLHREMRGLCGRASRQSAQAGMNKALRVLSHGGRKVCEQSIARDGYVRAALLPARA